MAETSIQWTDKVWNPVTGCDKVSPGCKFCYAEVIADRFWATQYPPVPRSDRVPGGLDDIFTHRPRQFTDVQTHEDRLLEPLKWRKPGRVFVNSMSDLFHEDVPEAFIDCVFAVMALADRHTFQILTKRPERMRAYFADADVVERVELQLWERHTDDTTNAISKWPLRNVWLGVSCENQQYADERIPLLLQTPAAIRFISAEPLLGPVDLTDYLAYESLLRRNDGTTGGRLMPALDWVIVGGESGHGARSCDLAWVRSIVQQCQAAGVACFYKQGGTSNRCAHDSKGGCMECAPADLRIREYPHAS